MCGIWAGSFSSPVHQQPAERTLQSRLPVPKEGLEEGEEGRPAERVLWWTDKGEEHQQLVPCRESRRSRLEAWGAVVRSCGAESEQSCQGQQGWPEPPGQKEGQIAETEPGPPQPCPSALPELGAPSEGSGAESWLSSPPEIAGRGVPVQVEAEHLAVAAPCCSNLRQQCPWVFLQKMHRCVLRCFVSMGRLLSLRQGLGLRRVGRSPSREHSGLVQLIPIPVFSGVPPYWDAWIAVLWKRFEVFLNLPHSVDLKKKVISVNYINLSFANWQTQ